MMRHSKQKAFKEAIFVRLFRLWAMGREEGRNPLPAMYAEAAKHRFSDQSAPACCSLFELTEGHLGRPLIRECCCSQSFSPDEKALLGVVRHAPALRPMRGSRAIPHGLPGAISWAASCVCEAIGFAAPSSVSNLTTSPANQQDCPFGSHQQGGALHAL
ncbi:MAG: hypothetical protein AAF692_08635 [Pseudomonadota bacterium]